MVVQQAFHYLVMGVIALEKLLGLERGQVETVEERMVARG